ncbi:MAG: hypothetical protein VX944_15445 [Myxococcota bacterium]|nr:hypothetical protein [Myxococcota bacterium]MEC9391466.1 hypothetical protein [Myxococcota bacterium]
MESSLSILDELRAHLAAVAPMRTRTASTPTGWAPLDAVIGGWPTPGVVSIHGAVGTGRMGVVLPAVRAHTQRQQTVAIVDPLGWIHPPGLPGVDLRHLMLVRCGATKSGWAAHQLAASGAVPLVIVVDPPPLARDGIRLIRATETGLSTTIVITEGIDPSLTAPVRIQTLGERKIVVERGAPGTPCVVLP